MILKVNHNVTHSKVISKLQQLLIMSDEVFVQVALLSETLPAHFAFMRFDSHVHPAMIQQVPASLELSIAVSLEVANIYVAWFS